MFICQNTREIELYLAAGPIICKTSNLNLSNLIQLAHTDTELGVEGHFKQIYQQRRSCSKSNFTQLSSFLRKWENI